MRPPPAAGPSGICDALQPMTTFQPIGIAPAVSCSNPSHKGRLPQSVLAAIGAAESGLAAPSGVSASSIEVPSATLEAAASSDTPELTGAAQASSPPISPATVEGSGRAA